MNSNNNPATNRILVVDDDTMIVDEYVRCFGAGFDMEMARSTLGDLEKVLFGEEFGESGESGVERFDVRTCHHRVVGARVAPCSCSPEKAAMLTRRAEPDPDVVSIFDVICFQLAFAAGCEPE